MVLINTDCNILYSYLFVTRLVYYALYFYIYFVYVSELSDLQCPVLIKPPGDMCQGFPLSELKILHSGEREMTPHPAIYCSDKNTHSPEPQNPPLSKWAPTASMATSATLSAKVRPSKPSVPSSYPETWSPTLKIHAYNSAWSDDILVSLYHGLKEKIQLAIVSSGKAFPTLPDIQDLAMKLGKKLEASILRKIQNYTLLPFWNPEYPMVLSYGRVDENRLSGKPRKICLPGD
ncbi:hypothetical protein VP01_2331g2 [Puccinia sorghi]|uniref:Uncharacterized protein n=1 Tax=Puccinia sorghi TaxID=27349 RepID=A0A0L6V7J9_9BASI|nr:hypothetical protein VP01_2331g2 [Puccinia sorghi]